MRFRQIHKIWTTCAQASRPRALGRSEARPTASGGSQHEGSIFLEAPKSSRVPGYRTPRSVDPRGRDASFFAGTTPCLLSDRGLPQLICPLGATVGTGATREGRTGHLGKAACQDSQQNPTEREQRCRSRAGASSGGRKRGYRDTSAGRRVDHDTAKGLRAGRV